ncbi:MAG: cation-translocating P-type ATPase [Mycoplasmoidaceae bacterium]|nr:MAG: cation-translocating P-type ATPase [Mycoplasmoidaceae bacterium]
MIETDEIVTLKNKNKTVADFIKSVESDEIHGLTSQSVSEKLTKNGENVLVGEKKDSVLKIILHQFKDLLNVMLLIIAIVDFATAPILGDKAMSHIIQGVVIFTIVFVNMLLAVLQEIKAAKAMDALIRNFTPTTKVMRDGKVQTVLTKNLVVGDIVYLEDGVIVPADLMLIETNSLKIDEGALTGESLPVEKDATVTTNEKTPIGDKVNFAFSSTIVTYGSGMGVVYATGMNTQIGKIATSIATSSKHKDLPPLKRKINSLVRILTYVAITLLVVMMVMNVILYVSKTYPNAIHGDYKFWLDLDTIISVVALAIALVPVALPVTTTIVLSISVSKMAKKNVLCKELTIVETLGNASIICSDKTGTLTLNKMTVTAVSDFHDIEKGRYRTVQEVRQNFQWYKHIVAIGMFCNNAISEPDNPGKYIGDPTEAALIVLGDETELDMSKTRDAYKRVFEQPFDSTRKLMTTVYRTKKGFVAYTKGAAEMLLDLCSQIETKEGIRKITENDKELIRKFLNTLSSKALRVLGMASRYLEKEPVKGENLENDLVFKGLVGMIDPPRQEAYDAIRICHEAGVKVAMITGDHQITALAIAHELKIIPEDNNITLVGTQIDSMSDQQLQIAVKDCCVFARVSPENKLRIVQTFKKLGGITAMTGDGTNDAPALKEADIGIAMGITGTDVAKGAASVLLLDDNFATIKTAINDGRVITRNIKNVINFILSTNFGTALFIVLFTYIFGFNAITITQRLLLDLVTDTLPCIFIGMNLNDSGIMKGRNKSGQKLLDKELFIDVLINTFSIFITQCAIFFISASALGIWPGSNGVENLRDEIDVLCFITLSLSRIFLSITYVSKEHSIFSKPGKIYNKLWMACGVSSGLLIFLVFTPFIGEYIVNMPFVDGSHTSYNLLDAWLLAPCFLLPVIPVLISEVKKLFIRKNKLSLSN